MNRTLRVLAALGLVITSVIAPAAPAHAHGSGHTTFASNYRTTITSAPDLEGLRVDIVDIDGTIALTWTGDDPLTVSGYENEPFLRIDRSGIQQNQRSPATYLNQDRFANVDTPETVDPRADPQWQTIGSGNRTTWHDHRTHWMSTALPPQVQAEPDRSHTIMDRWEIPITVGTTAHLITGNLTWTPPPSTLSWLIAAVLIGAVGAVLMRSRPTWAPPMVGALATVALTYDSIATMIASDDTWGNKTWPLVYPAVLAVSTGRVIVHIRRRTPHPTLATMNIGLIAALMGGVGRFDVLRNSQVFSALPADVARVAAVIGLGLGAAMLWQFARFLTKPSTLIDHPSD